MEWKYSWAEAIERMVEIAAFSFAERRAYIRLGIATEATTATPPSAA